MLQGFVPAIVYTQNGASIESLFDAAAEGTALTQTTIQGTREDGSPWTYSHKNRHASSEPAFEVANRAALFVEILQRLSGEEIGITDVDTRTSVQDGFRTYTVDRVLVAKGNGPFLERDVVTARPLTRLRVRVFLRPNDGGASVPRTFSIRVRAWAVRNGFLRIGGAPEDFLEELLFDDEEGLEPFDFDELLALLRTLPRNDVLTVEQRARGIGGGVRVGSLLDRVVEGEAFVFIRPDRRPRF
jgi:hypothetical protein